MQKEVLGFSLVPFKFKVLTRDGNKRVNNSVGIVFASDYSEAYRKVCKKHYYNSMKDIDIFLQKIDCFWDEDDIVPLICFEKELVYHADKIIDYLLFC